VNGRDVLFLSPTFFSYRVPVFEALYSELGEGFAVVGFRHQGSPNAQLAVSTGSFPRYLVSGKSWMLTRRHLDGEGTPCSVTWSLELPFLLARIRPHRVISINFNLWTLISLAMGFPTVVFWEGTQHTERTVGPWRYRLRCWMARRGLGFVVNGRLSRDYLIQRLGVPDERIFEGGMCPEPPPAWVSRRPRVLDSQTPVRFLFVGRMIEGKGVRHLLKAVAVLQQRPRQSVGFQLSLLGDGPLRDRYSNLARELGVEEHVRFLGHVASGEVWRYYSDAHVFVLPTLQDNWPLVVPEAMSVGLPILLSNRAGSVPELIREGENGYSFNPEDHGSLAACMERYLENPDLVSRHGQRSLELVAPYTPENAARAFLRAIHS